MEQGAESDGLKFVRIACFVSSSEIEAFDASVTKAMREMRRRGSRQLVPEENVLRYNHGRQWTQPLHPQEPNTTMHTLSAKWVLPWQDLVDNDLGAIGRSLAPVSASLDRQFAEMMYSTIGAAAESVGNVVDAKAEGSLAASLLEMMRKVEFGVGRDGKVSRPEIHVGPEMGERIMKELQSQPPEFGEEVERIQAEKIAQALSREAERKARFRKREQ